MLTLKEIYNIHIYVIHIAIPGGMRRHSINKDSIDPVCSEYSGFWTTLYFIKILSKGISITLALVRV